MKKDESQNMTHDHIPDKENEEEGEEDAEKTGDMAGPLQEREQDEEKEGEELNCDSHSGVSLFERSTNRWKEETYTECHWTIGKRFCAMNIEQCHQAHINQNLPVKELRKHVFKWIYYNASFCLLGNANASAAWKRTA